MSALKEKLKNKKVLFVLFFLFGSLFLISKISGTPVFEKQVKRVAVEYTCQEKQVALYEKADEVYKTYYDECVDGWYIDPCKESSERARIEFLSKIPKFRGYRIVTSRRLLGVKYFSTTEVYDDPYYDLVKGGQCEIIE